MFIEIEEDVIKDAIGKKDFDVNESMDLLIQMAMCARRGKHIVSVPCLLTNKAYRKDVVKLIGKGYFSALDYFNQKRIEFGQILRHLSVKVFITYEDASYLPNNSIRIIPHQVPNFEPWVETHVLTENLIDSSFYIHLAYYYFQTEVLGGRKGSSALGYKFYPLMGGGVTIEKVLQGEIVRGQHFCLALADSDKKYKGDIKVGDTAQKMIDLMNNVKPFNCSLYVMEQVREIENLLPRKIVEKFGDKTGFMGIFDLDPSFYDMKVGLSLTELYHQTVYEYWRNMFNDPTLFQERDRIKQQFPEKKKYDEKVKGKAPVKKGFGSNLLLKVIGNPDIDEELKRFKPKMVQDLFRVSPDDLTPEQQEEWKNIGQLMFSWTCCLKAKY